MFKCVLKISSLSDLFKLPQLSKLIQMEAGDDAPFRHTSHNSLLTYPLFHLT